MSRRVFFSFSWDDHWAVNQIRNIGQFKTIDFCDYADIEKIKHTSDEDVKRWIDNQLLGVSVTCVLIGVDTAESRWVRYEIEQSYKKGKGLLGIFIHNLKNKDGLITKKGENPFPRYIAADLYDPTVICPSSSAYSCIGSHIEEWVKKAAQKVGR